MSLYLNGEKINFSENLTIANRAFLKGDAVTVYFFIRNGKLILAEECYFFLMASMRKMRMNIPLGFTLEFFTNLFEKAISENDVQNGNVHFIAYRNIAEQISSKTPIQYYFTLKSMHDILSIHAEIELDLMKEINVNTHLLSNIRTHCPENIYAEIYAQENDLDDVILLNPSKRIARSIYGNLLFLENGVIKVPKQTEGAYISPLMEAFVTHVHQSALAGIEEAEIIAFESQKAEEILCVSDEKGIFSVKKIRNKTFTNERFTAMLASWKASFQQPLV